MKYSPGLCLEVERETAEMIVKNPEMPLKEAYGRILRAHSIDNEPLLSRHNSRTQFFNRVANEGFSSLDLAVLDLARKGIYDTRIGAYLAHCHISPFEITESQDTMVECYLGRLIESRNAPAIQQAFSDLRSAEDDSVSDMANELWNQPPEAKQ